MIGLLVWFAVTAAIAAVLRAVVGAKHLSQTDAQRIAGDVYAVARGGARGLARRHVRRALFRTFR